LKKIISLVLVVVMVMGCISLIACGGGGEEGGTTPPSNGETTPPSEEETTPPPSDETLGEILGRGAGIDSVKYDMLITAPGAPTVTMHFWVKHNKMRTETTEQGQNIVMLVDYDEGVMYVYMPDENMAMKVDFGQAAKSAVEEAQAITNYNPHIIGTETRDGKVCLVAEYTVEQVTAKMWIWKEHGFPIRIETTTTEGKTIIEFKNIEFADILDRMFELPEGVQIM